MGWRSGRRVCYKVAIVVGQIRRARQMASLVGCVADAQPPTHPPKRPTVGLEVPAVTFKQPFGIAWRYTLPTGIRTCRGRSVPPGPRPAGRL